MPDAAAPAEIEPPASDARQAQTVNGAGPTNPWQLGFWSLIVTQFQGAFSANVLRYLLTFMVLGMALNDARRNALVSLITLLFFIPLVLFSMAGGFLADRFSKRSVTIATKIIEIAAMALAVVALSAPQKADLAQVTEMWH